MPTRNKKPCNKPGCPDLVPGKQIYCSEHRKNKEKRKRLRDKQYNKKRYPKLRKFYGSRRWKKVRNRYIKRNPLCEKCQKQRRTKPAEVVDHIVPVKVDWSKRLDSDNLQSLCNSCHRRKTEEDKKKYDL